MKKENIKLKGSLLLRHLLHRSFTSSVVLMSCSLSFVGLGPLFEVHLICLVLFSRLILVPSWCGTVMLNYKYNAFQIPLQGCIGCVRWRCSQVCSLFSFSVPRECFPLYFLYLSFLRVSLSAECTFFSSDSRRSKLLNFGWMMIIHLLRWFCFFVILSGYWTCQCFTIAKKTSLCF